MTMRRAAPVLLALVLAVTSLQAEAKRLGGGRSMGRQSSNVMQRQAPTQPPATPYVNPAQQNQAGRATPAPAPVATPPARRPWAGMLGGLAAGLGLAWLAHSLGLGAGFGNVLLLVLLAAGALMLWRLMRGRNAAPVAPAPMAYRSEPAAAGAGPGSWQRPDAAPVMVTPPAEVPPVAGSGGSMIGSALAGSQNWGIPAGFDTEGFLNAAKRNFVSLQHAWDRGDLHSLRAMMTDDLLAETRAQLAERGPGVVNKTEVSALDAQLLGIEETPSDFLASVEFTGMVKEEPSAAAQPLREVWNMSKAKQGGAGWLVAGIQPMAV